MADARALRAALAAFLGEARFRKFVKQGMCLGRLRYWQEQEWSRFIAVHPEFAIGLDELADVLRICELHGDELLADRAEVFGRTVDYADWYIHARNQLFPHAAIEPEYTHVALVQDGWVRVWYCPACRKAEAELRARNVFRGVTTKGEK